MSITLTIPDSVLHGLRLPEGEVELRLRTELAISLYAQGILSIGKAAELAQTTRASIGGLLAQRGHPRHYSQEDLMQDLSYARGE